METELFTVVLRDRKNGLHPITGIVEANRDAAIARALEIAKNEGLGTDLQVEQVQPQGCVFPPSSA